MTKSPLTGYTPCGCCDCAEIAIDDEMCILCKDAGCEEECECLSSHSYGGDPTAD
jgi:hypothetical protein